nr:hypothetical protein [Bacteroides intestinalis]
MYYLIDINNVEGNDKNARGEAIKQKFRAYNSMDDYAKDKVQFLKKLYDFDENDDIATFTSKLTGVNKGKRRYAEAKNYNTLLTNVYNKIAKGQEGLKINWKPDRPSVDVKSTVKEYGPSFASMILTGNPSSFINKILEGKKPSLDYTHKFGSTDNKFQEFASVMTPIFKEALEKNGYPLTNLNNIVRQAALESSYGLDPRGERGFNLGGIKHPGDSIAPKYKKTKHTDGEYYIDFDNLGDYASYKVKLLNDRYNALDARNTNDFIDRLHGNNPNKSNYSADKKSYLRNLNGTKSLDKFLRRGGVIKYQPGGKTYTGSTSTNYYGDVVHHLPVWNKDGETNVGLPEVAVTPRNNLNLEEAVNRGRNAVGNVGKEILSAVTPLGDIESAKDIYNNATSGNYGSAALGLGLLVLPNFIEKPLKAVRRVGKDYVMIAKDAVGSPKRFIQARKEGTYPLTYKERKNYLENVHKKGKTAASRVRTNNKEDLKFRQTIDPEGGHEFKALEGANSKYTYNSKSYKNFDNPKTSDGVNSRGWNINSHINLKQNPNSKFLKHPNSVAFTTAHELQHSYQNGLSDIRYMRSHGNSPSVSEWHEASSVLTPLKKNAGVWEGDPLELNSEVMAYRAALDAPRYNLMTPEQQYRTLEAIKRTFGLNSGETHKMLNELGKLGYKNGGKL